jgi:hypothetical protein
VLRIQIWCMKMEDTGILLLQTNLKLQRFDLYHKMTHWKERQVGKSVKSSILDVDRLVRIDNQTRISCLNVRGSI